MGAFMFEKEKRALFPMHCIGDCSCFDTSLCGDCLNSILLPDSVNEPGLGSVSWLTPYSLPLSQKVVQRLKFHSTPQLGHVISPELRSRLPKGVDIVIPVPLHAIRKHQRGYNQAELLCEGLKAVDPTVLIRERWTRPQSKLSKKRRSRNLEGAFTVLKPELVLGKNICLVDDVFTTGSTLKACAQVLREAGALSINALVFAKSDDSIDTRLQKAQTSPQD